MDEKLIKSNNYSEFLRKNTDLSLIKVIQLSYELQSGTYECMFGKENSNQNKGYIENCKLLKEIICKLLETQPSIRLANFSFSIVA